MHEPGELFPQSDNDHDAKPMRFRALLVSFAVLCGSCAVTEPLQLGWTARAPGKDVQLAVFIYASGVYNSVSEDQALVVQRAFEAAAEMSLRARGYNVLRDLQPLRDEFLWIQGDGTPHSMRDISRTQGSTQAAQKHAAATWAKLREQRATSPRAFYLIACIHLARLDRFSRVGSSESYGEPVIFVLNYYDDPKDRSSGCQKTSVGFALDPAFTILGDLNVKRELWKAVEHMPESPLTFSLPCILLPNLGTKCTGRFKHKDLAKWGKELGESMVDGVPAR